MTTDQSYACIVCGTTYGPALPDDCRHCGAELAIFKCEEGAS
jgi:rubrerythrin